MLWVGSAPPILVSKESRSPQPKALVTFQTRLSGWEVLVKGLVEWLFSHLAKTQTKGLKRMDGAWGEDDSYIPALEGESSHM